MLGQARRALCVRARTPHIVKFASYFKRSGQRCVGSTQLRDNESANTRPVILVEAGVGGSLYERAVTNRSPNPGTQKAAAKLRDGP